jgi:hypothetical protein
MKSKVISQGGESSIAEDYNSELLRDDDDSESDQNQIIDAKSVDYGSIEEESMEEDESIE